MTSTRDARDGRPDEGSALILVLVLMVVGALIILPLMDFAMSVMRHNTVLSIKTARAEAVKAGLRLALADSTRLYDTCGPPVGGANTPIALAAEGIDVPVKTNCYFLESALALDTTQVRYGLAAVQKGQTVPTGMISSVYVSPDPTSTNAWLADTTLLSVTDKVWLPDLPTHGLSPRSPLGWEMPVSFATPAYPTCTVYFPGTYPNPVTLDGATYFASGIYYFEDTLLITGGANVVVGGGGIEGCTNDQSAAFYAINAPSTHNINGLGATFVLGDAGRIVVANDDVGPAIKVRFNRRYVADKDYGVAPSAGVSIVSVNGKLGAVPGTGENLLIPDVLEVPLSYVGEAVPAFPVTDPLGPPTPPVSAIAQNYLPSTLVPPAAPTVPDPPTNPVATGYLDEMQVSWTAPVINGGSQIERYIVRVASPAGTTSTCETVSNTICVVTGLVPLTNYTFTVEARNAVGTSALSVPSAAKQTTLLTPSPTWTEGSPLPALPAVYAMPIIEISLPSATVVDVQVPGYISIPQGRLKVSNPHAHPITLNGGVLVASFDIADPRVPVPIGLENTIAQGRFKIVTETVSGSPHMVSSAIVQVNQGGGYAVNSWEVQAD